MLNRLLITITLFTLSAIANANTWTTRVNDDLFSETGKRASLMGYNNGQMNFLAECNSKSFSFHILFKQESTPDEKADAYNTEVTYAIKVDEEAPYVVQGAMRRRNTLYLHVGKAGQKPTAEEVTMLKGIGAAKKRVILGIDSGDQQFSNTLSASGSTEAVKTFLSTCSY